MFTAAHQLYRQPAEDSICVCSCPPIVQTTYWRQYLCLQLHHTSCTDSLLKTVLVSAATPHQLYGQPAEDSTGVYSCPPTVETTCWREYLCLQLPTSCTDSLLKTVLGSAAAHQLYRQRAEDSTGVYSCPPTVQTTCWREYLCLQLPNNSTGSLLKTVLGSAAAHQLHRQPAEHSTGVCSCPPAVQTACWGQCCCLQLHHTSCTDSLLSTVLVFELPRLFILLFEPRKISSWTKELWT